MAGLKRWVLLGGLLPFMTVLAQAPPPPPAPPGGGSPGALCIKMCREQHEDCKSECGNDKKCRASCEDKLDKCEKSCRKKGRPPSDDDK